MIVLIFISIYCGWPNSLLQVKSEFFDALSSAEKKAHDYHSKFEALREGFEKSGKIIVCGLISRAYFDGMNDDDDDDGV